MKRLLLVAIVVSAWPIMAQAPAPAFTDAQLLQAERYKSAVLKWQLDAVTLQQQKERLLVQEAALNEALCGAKQHLDFGTMACVADAGKDAPGETEAK